MDKISLNVLFPDVKQSKYGSIDVRSICDSHNNTIAHPENKKYKKSEFDPRELIEQKRKKVAKIKNLYRVTINKCLDKIKHESERDKTETIFHISNELLLNDNFDVDRCMRRLENKLQDMNIDTLRLSYSQLFISWYNIH